MAKERVFGSCRLKRMRMASGDQRGPTRDVRRHPSGDTRHGHKLVRIAAIIICKKQVKTLGEDQLLSVG